MPRFFVNAEQIDGEKIYIVGDDAFHISRALRMAAGESITVCDDSGIEYECILEDFLPDKVGARITASQKSETEPPFKAHIYQGLPKGDKLETVIQKSVECGAASVTTFESDFCIAKAKPDGEKNTYYKITLNASGTVDVNQVFGENMVFVESVDSVIIMNNTNNGKYTVYNSNCEHILTTESTVKVIEIEGKYVATTEVDGKTLAYILK